MNIKRLAMAMVLVLVVTFGWGQDFTPPRVTAVSYGWSSRHEALNVYAPSNLFTRSATGYQVSSLGALGYNDYRPVWKWIGNPNAPEGGGRQEPYYVPDPTARFERWKYIRNGGYDFRMIDHAEIVFDGTNITTNTLFLQDAPTSIDLPAMIGTTITDYQVNYVGVGWREVNTGYIYWSINNVGPGARPYLMQAHYLAPNGSPFTIDVEVNAQSIKLVVLDGMYALGRFPTNGFFTSDPDRPAWSTVRQIVWPAGRDPELPVNGQGVLFTPDFNATGSALTPPPSAE